MTSEERSQEVDRIVQWWRETVESDIERTIPKALQYGAFDLDVMAQAMVALLPINPDAPDAMLLGRYAAVQFYALGKVARAISALAEGRLPHPDSEFDTGIYQMMARRIRETGIWL